MNLKKLFLVVAIITFIAQPLQCAPWNWSRIGKWSAGAAVVAGLGYWGYKKYYTQTAPINPPSKPKLSIIHATMKEDVGPAQTKMTENTIKEIKDAHSAKEAVDACTRLIDFYNLPLNKKTEFPLHSVLGAACNNGSSAIILAIKQLLTEKKDSINSPSHIESMVRSFIASHALEKNDSEMLKSMICEDVQFRDQSSLVGKGRLLFRDYPNSPQLNFDPSISSRFYFSIKNLDLKQPGYYNPGPHYKDPQTKWQKTLKEYQTKTLLVSNFQHPQIKLLVDLFKIDSGYFPFYSGNKYIVPEKYLEIQGKDKSRTISAFEKDENGNILQLKCDDELRSILNGTYVYYALCQIADWYTKSDTETRKNIKECAAVLKHKKIIEQLHCIDFSEKHPQKIFNCYFRFK